MLTFAAGFKSEGLELREFSPGGGFAIGYVTSQLPPPIADYADVITRTLTARSRDLGLGEPRLVIEPGRAIVGRAGVALYTVGAVKDIPTVRKYVSLDGGMGDNIRPAMYDAVYEAVVANRMTEQSDENVTLVGKFCESGDYLIRDIALPVHGAGRRGGDPIVGRLRAIDGVQLQPERQAAYRAGQRRRLPGDSAAGDVRGHDAGRRLVA